MKKHFIFIALAFFSVILIFQGCGQNRVDEKLYGGDYSFIQNNQTGLALNVEWPDKKSADGMMSAPPEELNLATVEVVLIESSLLESEISDENEFHLYEELTHEFEDKIISKQFDITADSPHRDGAEISEINEGNYYVLIAGFTPDDNYGYASIIVLKTVNIKENNTTVLNVEENDWFFYEENYEPYEPDSEIDGFSLFVSRNLPLGVNYTLTPEPDENGRYDTDEVVLIQAEVLPGYHFCYFVEDEIISAGEQTDNFFELEVVMDNHKYIDIIVSNGENVIYVSSQNGLTENDGLSPLSPVSSLNDASIIFDTLYTTGMELDVRLEGNSTGQTYTWEETGVEDMVNMDANQYFNLSGGWDFNNIESGQHIDNKVIFDAQQSLRHITIDNVQNAVEAPIEISYISFQNGISDEASSIFIAESAVNITSCEFYNNSGDGWHYGAALTAASGSSVNIINSRFSENTSSSVSAIYAGELVNYTAVNPITLIVDNVTFDSNDGSVFGISNSMDGSGFIIKDSIFSNNTAINNDGVNTALYALNITDGISVTNTTYENNTYSTNNDSYGAAGAMYFSEIESILIDNCELKDNELTADALGIGGAVYFHSSENVGVLNSSFINNNTINGSGGALYFSAGGVASSTLMIEASSFENNRASSNGGAVLVEGGAHLGIKNNNFDSNSAIDGFGGGLFIGSNIDILTFNENGDYDLNNLWTQDNIGPNDDQNAAGYQNIFTGNTHSEGDGAHVYFEL
ncbi:MAG: hypothetical protein ACQESP_10110 [Candidatus Muiribacteriota bacterium]